MNAVSPWWLFVVVTKIVYLVDANWITGNLCWSMPCMNGGSCFGSAYAYLCICPINYSGVLCENRLGVCQENPCGNRGSCVEKSLTSFECRCYRDYTGPTCEEHVPKNDPDIWSSLLPAQTRLLFDMLQEAYHKKVRGKSLISSNNGQIDFIGLLTTDKSIPTTSMPMTSTTIQTTFITPHSETPKTEHVIQAQDIQLEKIFPNKSIASNLHVNISEQSSRFDNPTTVPPYPETDMTSNTMITENMSVAAIEQIQPASLNTTENTHVTEIITSVQSSNAMTPQNLIEESKPMDFTPSNTAMKDSFYSLDRTIFEQSSSINRTTIPQVAHNQLLYNLCKQILSNMLPNISSSAAATAVLTLISESSSIDNKTADALLSWLNTHFNSSTSSTPTTTVSSLLIQGSQTSSIPLQRINMDDILYQINNNIDTEH